MSGAEEIWRTSAERARALDFEQAMRLTGEALRILEEAPGLVTWRREVRDGNVAYDGPWPPAQALGDYPPRCGRCGRPAGHETPPCPSCPDRNRMALAELGLRPPPGNLCMPPRRFPERELTEAETDYVRQSWEEALARSGNPVQVLGYERDGQPIPVPAPPPPPPSLEEETRALIAEPLGLDPDRLPAYGTVPEGCCRTCLRPPKAPGYTRCAYCLALARLQAAPPVPPTRAKGDRSGWPGLIIVVGAFLILAAHLGLWWLVPAGLFFAAGLWRGRS